MPTEDAQDKRLESEMKQIAGLAANTDWQLAKRKLIEKIASMTSLLDMTAEEVKDSVETLARKRAADLLGQWILEIDGAQLSHDTIQGTKGDDDFTLRIGKP